MRGRLSILTRSLLGVDPAPAMLLGNTLALFPLGLALGSGFGAGATVGLWVPGVDASGSRLGLIAPLTQTHAPLGSGSR